MDVPTLKSAWEIEQMRAAGRIVADCHRLARQLLKPGVRTIDLDRAVADLIREKGAEAAFKGYKGFPASICVSVNEEIVHGIPGGYRIRDGDLVSIDIGVRHKGYYGDAADTILVGNATSEARRLVEVCCKSLALAISVIRPGERLSTVCRTVQTYVESNGFSVVRKFVGHGIGSEMHEPPQVPNYLPEKGLDPDIIMKPGLTIAIEPMVNVGTADTRTLKDNWTVVTKDGKLSAHVEHTVLVTESGYEILTLGANEVMSGATAA